MQGQTQVTLTAEVVEHTILDANGKQVIAKAYGFNGITPGPSLVFNQGDNVGITVISNFPEPTAVHWHGVIVPKSQDGVPRSGSLRAHPPWRVVHLSFQNRAGP